MDSINLLNKPTLTPEEYAEIYQISLWNVHDKLTKGEIEGAFKIGRLWRIASAPIRRKLCLDDSH